MNKLLFSLILLASSSASAYTFSHSVYESSFCKKYQCDMVEMRKDDEDKHSHYDYKLMAVPWTHRDGSKDYFNYLSSTRNAKNIADSVMLHWPSDDATPDEKTGKRIVADFLNTFSPKRLNNQAIIKKCLDYSGYFDHAVLNMGNFTIDCGFKSAEWYMQIY